MSTLGITYIGHSSAVIQTRGMTLYTDPHFGRRALWAKRRRPLPIAPEQLPPPDAVLISHAHYDHLDLHSFKYIASHVPVIVPHGLAGFLGRFICNPIVELSSGCDFLLQGQVPIRSVPVAHRGGRFSGLRYQASCGYVIEAEGGNVYFPGDTAYAPYLKEAKQYGPIAVAFLPIGPCYPKFFMRKRHLTPELALQLCEELDAKTMIPIHWGIFRMGMEGASTPLHWLKDRLAHSAVKDRVRILEPGQSYSLS